MPQINRPVKQGGATTYGGKVSAGYTTILASEMDADLDTIYSAWNTGVDSSNIQPGSITGDRLAPGAVGTRELADSGVQTIDLADGCVTSVKIADGAVATVDIADGAVTQAKLSGPITPSSAAGGDLSGSYPNPSLGVVQGGRVTLNPRMGLLATSTYAEVHVNTSIDAGFDNTKPSWTLDLDYSGDQFVVWRTPVSGGAVALLLVRGSDGRTVCTLADGSVVRGQLAVNSVIGGVSTVAVPVNFSLSTSGVWTTYATLPAMTTRGGYVQLIAETNLSVSGQGGGGGGMVAQRWLRDGANVLIRTQIVNTALSTFLPLSGIHVIDTACPAGSHTYVYQVLVQAPAALLGGSTAEGTLQAIEVG